MNPLYRLAGRGISMLFPVKKSNFFMNFSEGPVMVLPNQTLGEGHNKQAFPRDQ
jgi:hypothetical protein